MKNPVKLSAISLLLLASCAASYAAPKRPWRVEVKTDGGFAGRGIGTYAVDSDADVTATLMNGSACSFTLTADELEDFEIVLGRARPDRWRDSYVPESTCCDRILYDLTYDAAGDVWGTRWIDAPLPMPADLVAVTRAMVSGDPASIRMLATERCK